jgi:hypothetical protein
MVLVLIVSVGAGVGDENGADDDFKVWLIR